MELSTDRSHIGQHFGFFTLYDYSFEQGDFQSLEGYPSCCPQFGDGTGQLISLGGLYTHPFTSFSSLSFRIGFQKHLFDMVGTETKGVFLLDNPDNVQVAQLKHTIDADFSYLFGEFTWSIHDWYPFVTDFGLQLATLLSGTFTSEERLDLPRSGRFLENGLRTRNIVPETTMPNTQGINVNTLFRIAYFLPMNSDGSWFLVPEMSYTLPLIDRLTVEQWTWQSVGIGVSLRKIIPLPTPVQKPSPAPPITPPPPSMKPVLSADVRAVSVNEQGEELPVAAITIESIIGSEIQPLLHYVFFDEGATVLPERYKTITQSQTESFSLATVPSKSPMDLYHHSLNIIAKRLKENPQASMEIVGCLSGDSIEQANPTIARQRAETVRDYFVNTWELNAERFSIRALRQPLRPSNNTRIEGREENRRVELYSSTPEILRPLILHDTTYIVTPPIVRFYPTVTSEAGVAATELTVSDAKTTLKRFSSDGVPPVVIDWNLTTENISFITSIADRFQYALHATDKADQSTQTALKYLPVEYKSFESSPIRLDSNLQIQKYNLILFDVNEATVTDENKQLLNEVKAQLSPDNEVIITGLTDRVGDEEYNLQLSQQRANVVKDYLNFSNATAIGKGETILFDNNLPEGRFYNRTVNVIIK
jgi:outer membrane protein OmpA-like peptidoglycan-associated protein